MENLEKPYLTYKVRWSLIKTLRESFKEMTPETTLKEAVDKIGYRHHLSTDPLKKANVDIKVKLKDVIEYLGLEKYFAQDNNLHEEQ